MKLNLLSFLKQYAYKVIALACIFSVGFALTAQYFFDVTPCQLCIYQRYGFIGLGLLAGLIILVSFRILRIFMLVATLLGVLLSFYQIGVENKIFEAPGLCKASSSTLNASLSFEDTINALRDELINQKPVPCDQVNWRIMGIPATYLTFIMNLFLLIMAFIPLWQKRRRV
jgi:disulfide bond formation protein DsbB